jgi:hypothetical protein
MTLAKLRLAQAAMRKRDSKVGELCEELEVTRQTLYRFVSPKGALRPDAHKLLKVKGSKAKSSKRPRSRVRKNSRPPANLVRKRMRRPIAKSRVTRKRKV